MFNFHGGLLTVWCWGCDFYILKLRFFTIFLHNFIRIYDKSGFSLLGKGFGFLRLGVDWDFLHTTVLFQGGLTFLRNECGF